MTSYNLDLEEHTFEDVKYIGDKDIDGSWKFDIDDPDLKAYKKESGVWKDKGGFTA